LPPFVADVPAPGMVSEPEAPPAEAAAPGALVPSAPN
jgi:hypothetical protein